MCCINCEDELILWFVIGSGDYCVSSTQRNLHDQQLECFNFTLLSPRADQSETNTEISKQIPQYVCHFAHATLQIYTLHTYTRVTLDRSYIIIFRHRKICDKSDTRQYKNKIHPSISSRQFSKVRRKLNTDCLDNWGHISVD